jgi:hypothetical protein
MSFIPAPSYFQFSTKKSIFREEFADIESIILNIKKRSCIYSLLISEVALY